MNILNEKYIIIEIIPTTRYKETGEIAELTALKLDGLNLIDRFNYRLEKDRVKVPDIIALTSYDNDKFNYVSSTKEILENFYDWSNEYPILILDNDYTNNYLSDLPNKKISICKVLDIEYSDNVIENLIKKYKLKPSNYIVDLLYESIASK
jgi:DNA polymerase III alpha subunit (gram-positive type)